MIFYSLIVCLQATLRVFLSQVAHESLAEYVDGWTSLMVCVLALPKYWRVLCEQVYREQSYASSIKK